ncbi:YciI family protein [Actinomadura sp. 9N407]|uniref:YciI family protein n=1 Tax=Actinomadura sp. 9N407 TaxID=3375154 RepID=UPI0037918360
MKFLLMIQMNDEAFEALGEERRNEIMNAHEGFQKMLRERGEMVVTHALADPSTSATVRVKDGVPAVTDGPFAEAKEYLAGYYVIDCESRERALEIAGRMPEAGFLGVEVRPIMYTSGTEM